MTETTTEEVVEHKTELGSQKYTHIISPPENVAIYTHLFNTNPSAQDIVNFARQHKLEVVALCGYRFVPDDDPEKYDACQICMDVAGMHMRNNNE